MIIMDTFCIDQSLTSKAGDLQYDQKGSNVDAENCYLSA